MVEKKPKVTYRQSKHKRSPPIWEVEDLYASMQEAVSLISLLEQIAENANASIEDIEQVTLPAELIFNVSVSYVNAYERLIKEGLLNSGNIYKVQPTLN